MREMKDSGIEWVGQIPNDWQIIRTLYTLQMPLTDGPHTTPELYDEGVPFVSAEAVTCGRGKIDFTHIRGYISEEFYLECCKKYVPQMYDIYMIKSGATTGNVSIVDTDIKFTIWSPLAVFRCNEEIIGHQFLFYSLQADYYLKQVETQWSYGTQQNIGMRTLEKLYLCLPPLLIQKQISDYLDNKCSEIESIISDIQHQIETLEQYKRSVITEAVTKGLDPDVEMRDSGVQWIGEIPTHWTLIRIGSLYGLRTQKVSDIDYPPLSVTKMGVLPQLDTVAKTNAHDDRKLVVKGDFVINSRSDRRGSCGISDYTGSVSLINTVLYPITEMNPRYYNWYFHTVGFADEFYRWGHGIVDDLWTTGWQDMKNILISVPPLDEQQQIADYLDSKCAEIDIIIAEKKQQIETIEEYKKSLIFEYVTGKKEVEI